MIEELLRNPYISLLLAVCTVIALPLTIVSIHISRKRKEFSYSDVSYSIARSGKKLIPQIKFTFNDIEIQNLTTSKVAIWNSGTEVLNEADVVKQQELAIIAQNGAEILHAEIIGASESTNNFHFTQQTANRVSLSFDYVEKHEGIVVQLFHTGDREDITLNCKIKGGKPVKNANPRPKGFFGGRNRDIPSIIAWIYVFMAVALTCVSAAMILAVFIPSLFTVLCVPPSTLATRVVLAILYSVLAIVIDYISFRMFNLVFHLSIPQKLRKYM